MIIRVLVLSIISHRATSIVSAIETDNSYHAERYNDGIGKSGDYMGPKYAADAFHTVSPEARQKYLDALEKGREEAGYVGGNPNEEGGYRGGEYRTATRGYDGNDRGDVGGEDRYRVAGVGYPGGEGENRDGEGGNRGGEGGYRGNEDLNRGGEAGYGGGDGTYRGGEGEFRGGQGGYRDAQAGYGGVGPDPNRGGEDTYHAGGIEHKGVDAGQYRGGDGRYRGVDGGYPGGDGGYRGGGGGYPGGDGGYRGGGGGYPGGDGGYRGGGGGYPGGDGGYRGGGDGHTGGDGGYPGGDGGYPGGDGGYRGGGDGYRGGGAGYRGGGAGYPGGDGGYRGGGGRYPGGDGGDPGGDGGYRGGDGGYPGGDGGYRGGGGGYPGGDGGYRGGGGGYRGGDGGYRGGNDLDDGYQGGGKGSYDTFNNNRRRNYYGRSFGERNYGRDFRYNGDLPYTRNERGRYGFGRPLYRREHVPDNAPSFNEKGERILGVYYSLQEVIDALKDEGDNSTSSKWYVNELLKVFDKSCRRYENRSIGPINDVQNRKRNIFINIEGTNREVRKGISLMVAKQMGGEVTLPPTSVLQRFRQYFMDNVEKKRAYFSLNYYAMGDSIKGIIRTVPIIVSSYWMDQCAYGVIKYFDDLPPANDTAYEWPSDLLRPDVLFFLNLPESAVYRGESNFYKIKLIEVYRKLKGLHVVEINSTSNAEEVVSIIVSYINKIVDGEIVTK